MSTDLLIDLSLVYIPHGPNLSLSSHTLSLLRSPLCSRLHSGSIPECRPSATAVRNRASSSVASSNQCFMRIISREKVYSCVSCAAENNIYIHMYVCLRVYKCVYVCVRIYVCTRLYPFYIPAHQVCLSIVFLHFSRCTRENKKHNH